jgi:phenylalanyl-tRNA synthetase beta chain
MKISIGWIRDYVDLPVDLSISAIMHDLTMATVEVEGAEDPGEALKSIVIGRIKRVDSLPGAAGALAICDVGRAEPIQVVCTGTGMMPGLRTIVALPGAKIRPSGSRGYVEIGEREVSGIRSQGAICRAAEVGLDGVLLSNDPDAMVNLGALEGQPGTALAAAIGWHDVILGIDNKSLTNRPDLWCHYGIARELAAIYGLPLHAPTLAASDLPRIDLLGEIDPELCNRFAALSLGKIEIGPSPLWLRSRLARLGQRPINVIVDLTKLYNVRHRPAQPCL